MFNQQEQENMFGNSTVFVNADGISFSTIDTPLKKEKNDKKWINDLDSTLILENIDRTAKNKVVKINLKLITLENTLARITEELKVLELFNLNKDKAKREQLLQLKRNIENQIADLKTEKQKFGFFYILSAYTDNRITYEQIRHFTNKLLRTTKKYLHNYILSNSKVQNVLKMVKR